MGGFSVESLWLFSVYNGDFNGFLVLDLFCLGDSILVNKIGFWIMLFINL